jgi:ribonuclease HI
VSDVYLYTDGGCHGNPGPGAWAWRLVDANHNVLAEASGFEGETTNNRMELTAVIDGLRNAQNNREQLLSGLPLVIITDSQYVRQGITNWIHRWKQNGWKTSAKKPVKNSDLWRTLDELNGVIRPSWKWVKGHAGDTHNEGCDRLVQETIKKNRSTL